MRRLLRLSFSVMTNEELLAALKTEIGWLRNELTFVRRSLEQQDMILRELRQRDR